MSRCNEPHARKVLVLQGSGKVEQTRHKWRRTQQPTLGANKYRFVLDCLLVLIVCVIAVLLLQEFLAEVLAKLPTFQPSYLANLLAAMARTSLRASPPPAWTAAVAMHVAPRMHAFSGGDLTQTLWGLAMLKVRVAVTVPSDSRSAVPTRLGNRAQLLAGATCMHQALPLHGMKHAAHRCAQMLGCLHIRNLCMLLYSFRVLGSSTGCLVILHNYWLDSILAMPTSMTCLQMYPNLPFLTCPAAQAQ